MMLTYLLKYGAKQQMEKKTKVTLSQEMENVSRLVIDDMKDEKSEVTREKASMLFDGIYDKVRSGLTESLQVANQVIDKLKEKKVEIINRIMEEIGHDESDAYTNISSWLTSGIYEDVSKIIMDADIELPKPNHEYNYFIRNTIQRLRDEHFEKMQDNPDLGPFHITKEIMKTATDAWKEYRAKQQ